MQPWTVLVADDNTAFLEMLAERINQEDGFEVVAIARDGAEALTAIENLHPDIVVLDLIMPKVDGLGVQERLIEFPARPKVVIISALGKDYITQQALALGADAFFVKPFDLDLFVKRLRLLMGETRATLNDRNRLQYQEKLERRVGEMLHQLAVAPHLRGYQYLKYAILCVAQDRGMLERITYHIYPAVAQEFNTTPSRVERAIRNAIENAWDRCRVETMEEFFGYSLDENKGKPSNSEFIAMVADKLTLDSGSQN